MKTGWAFTAQAVTDLISIWTYYADNAGQGIAEKTRARIESAIRRVIVRHPHSGRPRPELGPAVHSFPVVLYMVYYEVSAGRPVILRVLHARRDLSRPLMSLLVAS